MRMYRTKKPLNQYVPMRVPNEMVPRPVSNGYIVY
jgi:hypothetical protein